MAPKTKITKEMVTEAAFEIVRESGYEALNVRMIAERLGCSTQPVLYQFKTMAEIREAAYRTADAFHTQYIMKDLEAEGSPFLAIGLAYIRFGREEPNLFRFLFQSDHFAGSSLFSLIDDPEMAPLLAAAQRELGCGEREIRKRFPAFVIAAHGYAALLANNALQYDEEQAAGLLKMIFDGMRGNQE